MTGDSPQTLTDFLYQAQDIHMVWYIMGCVGIVSALGIYVYGKWILTLAKKEQPLG